MTDITELAQREKFEAWAEERCALPWGYLKNRRTNTGYFSKHDYTNLWAAWKAAGAEMVEALEKAQKSNEFLKGQLSELANFNPDWDKLEASYESWREIAAELLIAKDRIAELEESHAQVIHARDHYKALWRESLKGARTVTVKLPDDAEHDIMAPVAAYLSEKFKWDGSATRWDGRKEYDVLAGRVKYALRMVIRRAAGIREAE